MTPGRVWLPWAVVGAISMWVDRHPFAAGAATAAIVAVAVAACAAHTCPPCAAPTVAVVAPTVSPAETADASAFAGDPPVAGAILADWSLRATHPRK